MINKSGNTLGSITIRSVTLAGDFTLLALFPFLGAISHENSVSQENFIRTVVPFAVSWLLVGAVSMSFTTATIYSRSLILQRVMAALIGSGVIAIAIRISLFDRAFSLPFAVVAILTTTLLIVGWRLIVAIVINRR